ncbi:MAG: hypothetical protein MK135_10415 [Polyangiaceae bacterium]|nr:hypothetical protein [Polyangiaceae bacterium]
MKNRMIAGGALLLAAACTPQPVEEAAKTEEVAPVAAQLEPKVAAAEVDESDLPALSPEEPKTELGDLPVPEDLEEEASAAISEDNLEAELERLGGEIEVDEEAG